MILCLDIGNTQIYGGVYKNSDLIFSFRKSNKDNLSSDELGLFLKLVLRENKINPDEIKKVGICCVVPDMLHSLASSSIKYFNLEYFVLQAGVKTGLKILYKNPKEVGADRIANAIAGVNLFPKKNLILVDFGTATTLDVITENKEYLGGMILPGPRLMMEVLQKNTAQLPSVSIKKVETLIGSSTVESIQAGLYHGNKAIIEKISEQIKAKHFPDSKNFMIVGTGGFSKLFEDDGLFDAFVPELVLEGIRLSLEMNQ